MADKPTKPPTGRMERKYLIWALIIIVAATVLYFVIRQFTPEPAGDATHGGPAPEYSAPPAIPQGIPEEGNGEALRELRPAPEDLE
jgi:hypothetical protein